MTGDITPPKGAVWFCTFGKHLPRKNHEISYSVTYALHPYICFGRKPTPLSRQPPSTSSSANVLRIILFLFTVYFVSYLLSLVYIPYFFLPVLLDKFSRRSVTSRLVQTLGFFALSPHWFSESFYSRSRFSFPFFVLFSFYTSLFLSMVSLLFSSLISKNSGQRPAKVQPPSTNVSHPLCLSLFSRFINRIALSSSANARSSSANKRYPFLLCLPFLLCQVIPLNHRQI